MHIKLGQPQDSAQTDTFLKVMTHQEENDEEQSTIGELIEKMGEYLSDTDHEPYDFMYMKEQIKKHFGDRIIINEINGKLNVTFWRPA